MTKSLLACPSNLSGEARHEWKRVSRQLHEAGLLSEADHDTLAKYCQAWADRLKPAASPPAFAGGDKAGLLGRL